MTELIRPSTIGLLTAAPILYLLRKWCNGGTCHSKARLDGKTVVITGANTGIGKETAIDLAKRGALVVMACRDASRGESALKDVKEKSGSDKVFLKMLDLASLNSIREFSNSFLAEYEDLHILINNAGVMMCPYMKTEDGFEMQFGVNHLGHFALTNLLLSRMVESTPSRIVNVSSRAHTRMKTDINFDDINSEKSYSSFFAYSQSKLANVLFTKELNKRLENMGVTTYVLHPGVISTELGRHSFIFKAFGYLLAPLTFKSPSQGAQTTIHCAVQEDIESLSGLYFCDCAMVNSSEKSYDEGRAKKLWELSEEMTGVKFLL